MYGSQVYTKTLSGSSNSVLNQPSLHIHVRT